MITLKIHPPPRPVPPNVYGGVPPFRIVGVAKNQRGETKKKLH